MAEIRPSSVIFDLDGTLVDSLPGIEFSVNAAFAACGMQSRVTNLRHLIGPPIRAILAEAGNVVDPSTLADLEGAFRRSYDSEGWTRSVCYPKVKSGLQVMHDKGHGLFVVTNKPKHISTKTLEKLGLARYINAVITRDSRCPEYSSKEQMIEYLLYSQALDRKSCLLVGDTQEDANAAAACGIQFAHARYGYGTIAENGSVPVHHTADNFSQILQLLTTEFAHDR